MMRQFRLETCMETFLQYSRGYPWKIPWVWEQCAGYPQIQRETAVGGKIVEGNPTGAGRNRVCDIMANSDCVILHYLTFYVSLTHLCQIFQIGV